MISLDSTRSVSARTLALALGVGVLAACSSGAQPNDVASTSSAVVITSNGGELMPFGGLYGTCVSPLGTSLTVASCTTSGAEFFGFYRVVGQHYGSLKGPAGTCIDYTPAAAGQVAHATLSACTGSPTQDWLVQGGQILSIATANGVNQCLDVLGGNTSASGTASLDVTECNGTASQVFWTAGQTIGFESGLADSSDDDHECLAVRGGGVDAGGASLDNEDCIDMVAQIWTLNTSHQITYSNSHGALCLGLDASPVNGDSSVELQNCSATNANQQWYFANVSGSNSSVGEVEIRNIGTPAAQCLTVGGGNSANGTTVVDMTCNGTAGQEWSPFLLLNEPLACVPAANPCLGTCIGGTFSDGCGSTYSCKAATGAACCARQEGTWTTSPPPAHCIFE